MDERRVVGFERANARHIFPCNCAGVVELRDKPNEIVKRLKCRVSREMLSNEMNKHPCEIVLGLFLLRPFRHQ